MELAWILDFKYILSLLLLLLYYSTFNCVLAVSSLRREYIIL